MTAADRTRRALLAAGLSLGGGLALGVRPAVGQQDDDLAVLEAALALEQRAVLAYDAAAGVLSGGARATAARLRDHEREHVETLAEALADMGGKRPPPPDPADVEGLGDVSDRAGAFALAIGLEDALIAAYHDAHARIQDAKLLQTVAGIMAAEGQHLVVLRQALGRDALPSPFEVGDPSSTIGL